MIGVTRRSGKGSRWERKIKRRTTKISRTRSMCKKITMVLKRQDVRS